MPDDLPVETVLVDQGNISGLRDLLLNIYTESGDDPSLVNDHLMKDYLERIEQRRLIVLGAVAFGQMIGYGAIERRIVDRQRHAYVVMSVLSEHWGRGIGRMLLSNLVNVARQLNEGCLHLDVAERNARARRLYEGFGFRYRSEFRIHPPHAVPHAVMRLDLRAPRPRWKLVRGGP